MEEKKKDMKLASTTSQPAQTITELLSKEEQNHLKAAFEGKSSESPNPSPYSDNVSLSNQQYPCAFQWQNMSNEQPLLLSKSGIPQQNPICQPVPQGQPTVPFWLPQRPGLQPIGTNDFCWPAPAVMGGAPSRNHPQVPNFCYHVGYPYPSFPGPWDPSSWWNQTQHLQPPCTYNFPGSYGHFSSPALEMPGGAASTGQSFHRGTIHLPAKISQKHQQLWEAQSAENVQLWNIIGQLQSEIADYKSRLTKLEVEVSSLKPTVEERTAQVTGTVVAGQAPKRGRPKRTVVSIDALPSPKEIQPRARGRKPSLLQVQSQPRELNFEKVILTKVENREKISHSITAAQQENNEKIPNVIPNIRGNMESNGSNLMSVFNSQAHQEKQGGQVCGHVGLNSLSETISNGDKVEDLKATFSILSQQAKVTVTQSASATSIEAKNNETLGWPPGITPEFCGRNVLRNMSSQGFYNNGSIIRQGGKIIPGWSFVNEVDASEEIEDAVVGSAKDENEEEMRDNASSGAEDIDHSKEEGECNMDAQIERSPQGLPRFSNW